MQTFLPYADYHLSARVLDNKRLGKQRVECKQILIALIEGRGWIHHPATKMWKGHLAALVDYTVAICNTWIAKGFDDSILDWLIEYGLLNEEWISDSEFVLSYGEKIPPEDISAGTPWFVGYEPFHLSHRSNLLQKNLKFYRPHFPDDPDNLDYIWPTYVKRD